MAETKIKSYKEFLEILKFEKSEISSIYFYAILYGLVQLSLPLGIQSIISFVMGGAISTSLVLLIIVVIIGVFVTGLLQVNQMKIIEKIQQQLFVRYSFQYANTIPKLNLKEVDGYYLPELVNRFFDTISLQKGISKLLLEIPAATIQIFFGLVLLSFYHPVFIFFGIMLISVLYIILRITSRRGLQTSLEESNFKYMVAGYLQDLARVVTTFKFSKDNSLYIKKTDEYVNGYLTARTSHFKILLFQYWTLIAFKVLITTAMLVVGAILLVNQQLNIGQFIAAEIVILMVIGSVEKLILNLDKIYDVLTSIEKITKVTGKPTEDNGNIVLPDNEKNVSVTARNLSFGYEAGNLALKDLSFHIPAGKKVCVKGVYCAGKSTLLRLLSGAYQSFEGSLYINDIPIGNYDLDSLRANTGILLSIQDIFQGTIKENVTLGDGNISYGQMDELAKIVGLKQFIDSKREGYDMFIQPTGQHLSGRIIKKILLMRALMHQPHFLLLEEPWLGLEEQYVQQIKDYLFKYSATTIVVTNDEDFAAKCDIVLELENGSLISTKEK